MICYVCKGETFDDVHFDMTILVAQEYPVEFSAWRCRGCQALATEAR